MKDFEFPNLHISEILVKGIETPLVRISPVKYDLIALFAVANWEEVLVNSGEVRTFVYPEISSHDRDPNISIQSAGPQLIGNSDSSILGLSLISGLVASKTAGRLEMFHPAVRALTTTLHPTREVTLVTDFIYYFIHQSIDERDTMKPSRLSFEFPSDRIVERFTAIYSFASGVVLRKNS